MGLPLESRRANPPYGACMIKFIPDNEHIECLPVKNLLIYLSVVNH